MTSVFKSLEIVLVSPLMKFNFIEVSLETTSQGTSHFSDRKRTNGA